MVNQVTSAVYPYEKTLFTFSFFISLIFWLLLIIGTVGFALIFLFMIFVLYLFAQSAFISYIKGTGAKISQEQFPDIYTKIVTCTEKLEMDSVPDAYIIHADGIFNALAARFLGRDFIILYSDIIDALADNPDAINFYIGHELAHIKRKHLVWGPLLWPAGILPILGAGYSRARETTCDLHGVLCCDNKDDAIRGLSALAVGSKRWKTINIDSYTRQANQTSGFWMSFHELTGDYPWLVKRIMRVSGNTTDLPGRNLLAWFIALFVPRMGFGAVYAVAMIGIVAAVAIPAYQDYMGRAQVTSGIALVSSAKTCVVEIYTQSETVPSNNGDCGLPLPSEVTYNQYIESISIDEGNIIMTFSDTDTVSQIAGTTMIFEPRLDENDEIFWLCSAGTLPLKYRPSACR